MVRTPGPRCAIQHADRAGRPRTSSIDAARDRRQVAGAIAPRGGQPRIGRGDRVIVVPQQDTGVIVTYRFVEQAAIFVVRSGANNVVLLVRRVCRWLPPTLLLV